ncbi:MAG TPA: hypothetical protein DCM25_07735 [Rhodobacteraceae bacterium]|nr:hypothetical protein [Paracoccaceae bacterium]
MSIIENSQEIKMRPLCRQTNADQSLNGQWYSFLHNAKLAPLSKSGGVVELEMISFQEAEFLI